jgi:hypothetical protein
MLLQLSLLLLLLLSLLLLPVAGKVSPGTLLCRQRCAWLRSCQASQTS